MKTRESLVCEHDSTTHNTVAFIYILRVTVAHRYLSQCLLISSFDSDISTAHYKPLTGIMCERCFRKIRKELLRLI
jgi:hypothetical protein